MVIRKDHGEGLLAQGAYLHTLGRREGLLPQVGRLGATLAPGDAIPLLQILPCLPAVGHGQLHLPHPGAEDLGGFHAVRRQHVQLPREVVQQHAVLPQGRHLHHPPPDGLQHIHIAQGVPLQVALGLAQRIHTNTSQQTGKQGPPRFPKTLYTSVNSISSPWGSTLESTW